MKSKAKSKIEKQPVGRPRIGMPLSCTFTDEQRDFLESEMPEGGSICAVVRDIVERERQRKMRRAS